MKISRAWAMPNKWTYQIKPIKALLDRYAPFKNFADPFCGRSDLCEFRNDLDSKNETAQRHKKAYEFLSDFNSSSLAGVLFDPPYSPRQISECYKAIGLEVSNSDTQNQWTKEKNEIARIIKPQGLCISFGWNSNGLGKSRGFEIIEISIVAHGGAHNDTIVTVEQKTISERGEKP